MFTIEFFPAQRIQREKDLNLNGTRGGGENGVCRVEHVCFGSRGPADD